MELRQVEYVVAIADHGSFTKAARAVHVSQPSLSHGIARLEGELGVELFSRLGGRVEPTAAGIPVIEAARRVLRDMADLGAAAASVASVAAGSVDLVALPTLAVDPVAALIGRFRIEHPAVLVRVHEPEDAADVERSVRAGQADLGLSDITLAGPGVVRVELFRQEVVVVSPPGTVFEPGPVTARALAGLPLIVTPEGTSTRRLLERSLARDGLTPNIAVEINYREAIVPLVLAGAGSALLPVRMAAAAAEQGATVRPLRPALSRRIGLLHRPTRMSPAARALADLAVTMLSRPRR